MAVDLSENQRAGQLIEQLYRQQYFVTRRKDDETSYQFHDLFREFLLDRLEDWKGADEVNHLRERAAAVLSNVNALKTPSNYLLPPVRCHELPT